MSAAPSQQSAIPLSPQLPQQRSPPRPPRPFSALFDPPSASVPTRKSSYRVPVPAYTSQTSSSQRSPPRGDGLGAESPFSPRIVLGQMGERARQERRQHDIEPTFIRNGVSFPPPRAVPVSPPQVRFDSLPSPDAASPRSPHSDSAPSSKESPGGLLAMARVEPYDGQHTLGAPPGGQETYHYVGGESVLNIDKCRLTTVEYGGWLPRALYILYPLLVFSHIPVTLFLDYNALYTLIQIALFPSLPRIVTSPTYYPTSAAVQLDVKVIAISARAGWWIAVGVYALCTAVWLFGVILWGELRIVRKWRAAVDLNQEYTSSTSFNYGCMRSYGVFSLLWRLRLAPFKKTMLFNSYGCHICHPRDFFFESLRFYSQNWPTALLLVPREVLALIALLLYGTEYYGSINSPIGQKDPSYFVRSGTLSAYATGVILANCCWAAYRILVVFCSFAGSTLLTVARRPQLPSSPLPIDNLTAFPSWNGSNELLRSPSAYTFDGGEKDLPSPPKDLGSPDIRRHERVVNAVRFCREVGTRGNGGETPLFGCGPSNSLRVDSERVKSGKSARKLKRSLGRIDWEQEGEGDEVMQEVKSPTLQLVPSSPIDLSFLTFPPAARYDPPHHHLQSAFSSQTSFSTTIKEERLSTGNSHLARVDSEPEVEELDEEEEEIETPPRSSQVEMMPNLSVQESLVDPWPIRSSSHAVSNPSRISEVLTLDSARSSYLSSLITQPPIKTRRNLLVEVLKQNDISNFEQARIKEDFSRRVSISSLSGVKGVDGTPIIDRYEENGGWKHDREVAADLFRTLSTGTSSGSSVSIDQLIRKRMAAEATELDQEDRESDVGRFVPTSSILSEYLSSDDEEPQRRTWGVIRR